jgi:hypothetical protein
MSPEMFSDIAIGVSSGRDEMLEKRRVLAQVGGQLSGEQTESCLHCTGAITIEQQEQSWKTGMVMTLSDHS